MSEANEQLSESNEQFEKLRVDLIGFMSCQRSLERSYEAICKFESDLSPDEELTEEQRMQYQRMVAETSTLREYANSEARSLLQRCKELQLCDHALKLDEEIICIVYAEGFIEHQQAFDFCDLVDMGVLAPRTGEPTEVLIASPSENPIAFSQ